MNKDGGPAFPFPSGPELRVDMFHERWEGMSLRDYFAIKLAAALLNFDAIRNGREESRYACEGGFEFLSTQAYIGADAMLAERSK